MTKKFTVDIATIKETANHCFLNSVDDYRSERKAIFLYVSDLLMKHNVYKGFRYLESHEVGDKSVGVIRHKDGTFTFPDDSRVAFI